VRRVDVIVCSTSAAEQVRRLAGPAVQMIIDDRALDQRAIEMLAALLVRQNGEQDDRRSVRRSARPEPSSIRRAANSHGARRVQRRGGSEAGESLTW